MKSCVVVFDGRVARVVYDDTYQYCSRCSHPPWNLVRPRSWCGKIHFETKKQAQKWEDWSFVHFSVRCMELDYTNVSRLLLVPPINVCETIKNLFQLNYQNLSWLQYCVLLPCVWLRNILRKWFVTTVLTIPTHVLQPQNFVRIFCNDSEAIFRVFQLFSQDVKYFYQKNTWKNSQIIFL